MNIKHLIKPVVSIAILAALLTMADFESLLETFKSIPAWVLLTVIAGYTLGQVLSAYKWLLIARSAAIPATYLSALKAYFIGMFVNCFGLGLIGGDLARAFLLTGGKDGKALAIASVAADRIHGLTVLAGLGSLVLLTTDVGEIDPYLSVFLPTLFVLLFAGWFLGPVVLQMLLPERNRFRKKCLAMLEVFPRSPGKIFSITVLSIIYHCLQIALHWVMGIGVGTSISLALLFSVIPLVSILTSLPISWNGLGVREYAYQAFLTPVPLDLSQALAFGAMWILASTFASALGGIAGMFNSELNRIQKFAEEEEKQRNAETSLPCARETAGY